VTLRKLAKAIEYSPGAIYQYFKDKQDLVRAIIVKDSLDLRQHLLECLSLDNPVEQLGEMARRYAAWGMEHPNHYRLLLLPPPAWSVQDRSLRGQIPLEQEILHVLNVLVKGAIDRGLLKEKYHEPSLVAATLWAGIHGVVLLEVTMTPEDRVLLGGTDDDFNARFNMLREVFLDGFLKNRTKG